MNRNYWHEDCCSEHDEFEAAGKMVDEHEAIHRDFDMDELKVKAKRWIAVLVFVAIALAWYGTTYAQTVCPPPARDNVCVTLQVPTTNTDGTPISATATKEIRIYKQSGSTWTQVGVIPWAQGQYWQTNLAVGTHTYRATAVVSGVESAPSNVGSKTVTAPVPNPPVLSVVETTAYQVKPNANNVLVATRIGYVPLGTGCSSSNQKMVGGKPYHAIPRASVDMVNWPAPVTLQEVFARCG